MAAIGNSFSGRRSFALLTRPRLNERAPAEEADCYMDISVSFKDDLDSCANIVGVVKFWHKILPDYSTLDILLIISARKGCRLPLTA